MNHALRPDAACDTSNSQAAELNHLHQLMREAFNLEELRELCLDLAIDYEDLGESLGKSDRILALIYTVVHQGRQQELGVALGPDDVIQRLFDALFESEPPLKVNIALARTYLSNTRPLVLLDRLSLPGAALEALPDLFPQSPLLLAASQRPAGDVAELVRLDPLPLTEAVQLLVMKAGLTAGESQRSEVEAIGDLLAGVPLAIVTAGNAIRENKLTPGQALARLAAYSPTSSDPVEAAVERAYALVYAGLSPVEQRMLSTVAALPGVSTDKAWLESVAGGQAASERLQALELLQANSPRLRLSPGLRPVALRSVDQAAAREQLLAFIRQALAAGTFDLAFCEDELGNAGA